MTRLKQKKYEPDPTSSDTPENFATPDVNSSIDNLEESSLNLTQDSGTATPLSQPSNDSGDEMGNFKDDIEDGEIVNKFSKSKKKKKHKKHKKKIKEEMSELDSDKLSLIRDELESVKSMVKLMETSKSESSEESFNAEKGSMPEKDHEEDL